MELQRAVRRSIQLVMGRTSQPLEGEVLWYDNDGAVCRCLNWRDGERTMLTEESQNVVAVIESVNAEQIKRANEAIEELSKLINHYFGVESSQVFHLTEDNPTAVVPK